MKLPCFPYGPTVSSPSPMASKFLEKRHFSLWKYWRFQPALYPLLCGFRWPMIKVKWRPVRGSHPGQHMSVRWLMVTLIWCTRWKLWHLRPMKKCCKLWAENTRPMTFLIRCSWASAYLTLHHSVESFFDLKKPDTFFLIGLRKYGYNFIFPIE